MKRFYFFALLALCALTINATELWTGTQHVSWDEGGLQIAASNFASATAGQRLVLTFTGATDGVEFKVMNANFDHLAGSREAAWISGDATYEQYLTQKAIDSLKLHGLEIIGANFTATKLELLDGRTPIEGTTIWMGYFWADSWSTLELFSDAYKGVDFSQIASIRFYSEAAGTDYVLNFKESWEEAGHIASKSDMTDGDGYAELTLTDDLRTKMANASHWMIQYNKEALEAFNVTEIVLIPVADDPTDIDQISNLQSPISNKILRNGQLYILRGDKLYNAQGIQL